MIRTSWRIILIPYLDGGCIIDIYLAKFGCPLNGSRSILQICRWISRRELHVNSYSIWTIFKHQILERPSIRSQYSITQNKTKSPTIFADPIWPRQAEFKIHCPIFLPSFKFSGKCLFLRIISSFTKIFNFSSTKKYFKLCRQDPYIDGNLGSVYSIVM